MAAPLPMIATEPPAALHEDGIWRDSVRQPIYSTVGYDAAAIPAERIFFGYAKGQNVPGAGNAAGIPSTFWHTNMTVAGQLEAPRKFRCDGICVYMPPLTFGGGSGIPSFGAGTADPGFSAAATADSELLEDWLLFLHSCLLRVKVGTKSYCEHPLHHFPANVGVDGLAAVDVDRVSAAADQHLDVTIPHSKGNGIAFSTWPFLIMPQQSFFGAILCPWPVPPALQEPRAITVRLDGNLHREIS